MLVKIYIMPQILPHRKLLAFTKTAHNVLGTNRYSHIRFEF